MPQHSIEEITAQAPFAVSKTWIREPEQDEVVETIPLKPAEVRQIQALLRNLHTVKHLEISGDFTWYRRALTRAIHRAARVAVHRPYPCNICARPVAALKLLRSKRVFIVDAIEERSLPGCWSADILTPHTCERVQ
jgi:hypothetical protein